MADSNKKEQIGIVVSRKTDSTAIVQVVRLVQHPAYKKVIKKRKKYVVHDAANVSKEGDKVAIRSTRPLSKNKRWKLIDVLKS